MQTLPRLLTTISRAAMIVGCFGLLLAQCSKEGGGQAAKASGQVVAHVGNEVVTIQELENEFRFANIPVARQKDPDTIRKVLGDLVLRKYLLQHAVADKLDREPGVLLDLLRAREQILASSYLTRAVAAKPPGKADIDNYIAQNPAKFSGRKILSIEQVGFPLSADSQSVIEANKNAKSLEEVEAQLTAAAIPHGRQMGALNSNDISPDFFATIEARKPDDVFFIRSGNNGVFFKVKGEEPRPLQGEQAADVARQLMRADALKAEAGMASVSANLDAKFEGDYAAIMSKSAEQPNRAN
jgi:EpsD family peptidyl-prolyl cis-trans isomerase